VLSLVPFLVAYFDFCCYPYTFILCISLRCVTLCNFVIKQFFFFLFLCGQGLIISHPKRMKDDSRFAVQTVCSVCFGCLPFLKRSSPYAIRHLRMRWCMMPHPYCCHSRDSHLARTVNFLFVLMCC